MSIATVAPDVITDQREGGAIEVAFSGRSGFGIYRWAYLPFDVPAGVQRIRVSTSHESFAMAGQAGQLATGNNTDYGPVSRLVCASPIRRRISMTVAVGAEKLTAGTWAIDSVHSSINFSVRHLMVGRIHGRFDQFSGAITITDDGTPSVVAEVGVDSIDTGNEQRDAHVKAADFFDVEQFPAARFESSAVRADGDDYVLEGIFTLKDVTKPVAMTLEFNGVNPGMGRGEVAGFEASVVLSRKDFGVGAELLLDGGGTVVGDKVTITLALEALKQV
jgi:polyisoprenoid-binding protein YceI